MRSEQAKSERPNLDTLKKKSSTSAPISLEDLMGKEVMSSSQDGTIRELSVLSDPSNEQSTKIKQKIRLHVEDAQCFPLEEGPGETVLVWACGNDVTN